MRTVAVLFAREDSIYKSLPNCDVYDINRDARTYAGNRPVVANPPCRAWGQLRHFAKPRPDEKDLARFAVAEVRRSGGVLEHPKGSTLWQDQNLPTGQAVDEWGGFTLHVDQCWWGHKARKSTQLYICGIARRDIPTMPIILGEPTHVVAQSNRRQKLRLRPELTKSEREHTPVDFAIWLVELASLCKPSQQQNEAAA